MKHLKIFESYEAPMEFEIPTDMEDFDPEKAKQAYSEYVKKIGGKSKDDTGLSFPIIKEVYGNDAYNTRFMIAQALQILGYSIWPYNSAFTRPSSSELALGTFYIGEGWQNEIMKKMPRKLLVSLRPWVEKVMRFPEKFIGNKDLQRITKSPEVSRDRSAIAPEVASFIATTGLSQTDSPLSWIITYR